MTFYEVMVLSDIRHRAKNGTATNQDCQDLLKMIDDGKLTFHTMTDNDIAVLIKENLEVVPDIYVSVEDMKKQFAEKLGGRS